MQEIRPSSQTGETQEGPAEGDISIPRFLQSHINKTAKSEESERDHENPEDEADRQIRAAGQWFIGKVKDAKFLDIVQSVLGILVLAVGVYAARVYNGQLKEMRHTNELTGQAIAAAQSANSLTKNLVENEYGAIVNMTMTAQPANSDSIVGGIGVMFVNRGKIAALNFRGTVTYKRVEIPSLRNIGNIHVQNISESRLTPIVDGQGGFESFSAANFDTSDITDSDIGDIRSQKSSVEMIVDYSYDNGFGDTIRKSQCWLYVYIPSTKPSESNYATWEYCRFGISIYRNYLAKKSRQNPN